MCEQGRNFSQSVYICRTWIRKFWGISRNKFIMGQTVRANWTGTWRQSGSLKANRRKTGLVSNDIGAREQIRANRCQIEVSGHVD